jgi:uncharacterized membrane protein YhdT
VGGGIGKFGQARKEIAEQLPASHLYSIDWSVEIFFRGTRGEAAQPDWIEEKEKKSEKENK